MNMFQKKIVFDTFAYKTIRDQEISAFSGIEGYSINSNKDKEFSRDGYSNFEDAYNEWEKRGNGFTIYPSFKNGRSQGAYASTSDWCLTIKEEDLKKLFNVA